MEEIVFHHPEFPGRSITIVAGDITKEKVDVIVNAANAQLAGGGGVDGAIHRAGGPEIMEECEAIRSHRGPLQGGEAVETTAGNLPAKHVIHTAGPIYRDGKKGEREHLEMNYANSLVLANELGAKSVAFAAISTGVYGYPFDEAIEVALTQMRDFLISKNAPERFACRLMLFGESKARDAVSVARRVLGN
ncbi:macro domain-containing protein [bacterium]|nr:macro domain-containing protein [bacterium]